MRAVLPPERPPDPIGFPGAMASGGSIGPRGPGFLLTAQGWPYMLVPFIPLAIVLEVAHASATVIFFTAALGIVPTAALMGLATEELAARSGPGIGGLLNVTFGNAPELIIALFALNEGLQEVVKASIIGSILGNILLGARRRDAGRRARPRPSVLQRDGGERAVPDAVPRRHGHGHAGDLRVGRGPGVALGERRAGRFTAPRSRQLSVAVAVVLAGTYVAGLVFSLKTHRDIFNPPDETGEETAFGWSARRAVLMLAIAGVAVGAMSEVLVGSIAEASESVGLSEFFIGIIVVAIVGNAAEHWVAVLVAYKNKMNLAVNIAIGSSAQVALFVAPILVFASFVIGPEPMALVFNGFELAALLFAVLIANYVTHEGESTWFEGVQLLAVYLVLGLAFGFA